jgi:hypothetical protein
LRVERADGSEKEKRRREGRDNRKGGCVFFIDSDSILDRGNFTK